MQIYEAFRGNYILLKLSGSKGNVLDANFLKYLKATVVSAFHAVGHVLSCQYKYNPRSVKYSGWCDYEGTERLWALINVLVRRCRHVSCI